MHYNNKDININYNIYIIRYNINDKKFVFVPDAIKHEHFTKIQVIQKEGVLIK